MSASADITLGTIGQNAGIPNLNVATVPANIREGGSGAMKAYSEGLAFESMLVSELSQQMSKTMFGGTGDASSSDPGGAPGSSSSSGLLAGASAYQSMIPQALTSSIMDDGGLGMAASFAQELDPALLTQGAAAAKSSAASTTPGTTSGTSAPTTASDPGSVRQAGL